MKNKKRFPLVISFSFWNNEAGSFTGSVAFIETLLITGGFAELGLFSFSIQHPALNL
ncbi:hypothetical protein [Chryseobacterium sp. G0240]|uniref:hypothetical protein n=1 Tax=Chryseobacterium sp. G0240 TaxID=2487066 RepID=UPI00160CAA5C|nr:hypothetical protein [Chryseobacterium sp. G0240]